MTDNATTQALANLDAGGTLYRYIDDSRGPPYIAEYKIVGCRPLRGGDATLSVADGSSRHRFVRKSWIDNRKLLDPFSSTPARAVQVALAKLEAKKALLQGSLGDVHEQLDRLHKLETALRRATIHCLDLGRNPMCGDTDGSTTTKAPETTCEKCIAKMQPVVREYIAAFRSGETKLTLYDYIQSKMDGAQRMGMDLGLALHD